MIAVNKNIFLTSLQLSDAAIITEYMRDREISDNTVVIPYPYTIEDANEFLEDTLIVEEETGIQKRFAIRNAEGTLLGITDLHLNYGESAGKTEFGYWLGKQHWNQGIMSAVIGRVCRLAVEKYGMHLLEAHVFEFNQPSMRVLLKNGFVATGKQKMFTKRTGQKVTALKYYKLLNLL